MAKFTTGGKEYISPASELLAKTFEYDPIITYMLCSMSTEARIAYLPRYFSALCTAAAMNKASFMEANDWESCNILMPPGHKVDNPRTLLQAGFIPLLWNAGIKGCHRMMGEWAVKADASKAKALAGQKKYYYVFFTATRDEARGKGLCSEGIRKMQKIAARDGLPLWLEATTERSHQIYAKLGFEDVDEIVIGKGTANPDGTACQGGPGVTAYSMIWWPSKS